MCSQLTCFLLPVSVRARPACAGRWQEVHAHGLGRVKGGLASTGRTLACFLFLTAFPRAVMVIAQLPVGENPWILSVHLPQPAKERQRSVHAAVKAETCIDVQTPFQ